MEFSSREVQLTPEITATLTVWHDACGQEWVQDGQDGVLHLFDTITDEPEEEWANGDVRWTRRSYEATGLNLPTVEWALTAFGL